jgi:hypothetical protein
MNDTPEAQDDEQADDRLATLEQRLAALEQRPDPEREFAERFRDALNASRSPWFEGGGS